MTEEWGGLPQSPATDRVLSTLSKRHRRLVLLTLRATETVSETDVIVRNAEEEGEIELRHNHLPKLEEEGYIEWNQDTGEITKGPRFEEIEPLLKLMQNHADELPPDWP